MLIVAERINATRKRIRKAIEERDAELIKKEAVFYLLIEDYLLEEAHIKSKEW